MSAAQGADLFVSIHHDSVKERLLPEADSFSGFSLFISRFNPKADKSLACASAIGAQLRGAGFTPSRYHYDNLAVGRSATMPSVLVEAGVIVNREEERRMREPVVRKRIAAAVAEGARDCLAKER